MFFIFLHFLDFLCLPLLGCFAGVISAPMSYIRLFENPAVLEKWYGMESRSVMEPAVLLLASLPCTIGIELRSNVPPKNRISTSVTLTKKLQNGRYYGQYRKRGSLRTPSCMSRNGGSPEKEVRSKS